MPDMPPPAPKSTIPLMKRALDLAVCLCLSVPGVVITLLVLPVVAWETRTTPLFRQTRVGQNGRPFKMLKLRTMRADTPNRASHEVGESSITRSGRFLRRTKVDELPQLFNVLMGEMTLVGPRPCLPIQTRLIEERARRGVLALRPGITGVGQVAGLDMSDPVALADADAAYSSTWSLRADLGLLTKTLMGKGRGDAAVARR